ncbi:MAG: hypothetical protein N3A54_00255 [Patescibacteria group bacterium]|nr:hypothetical protein [Patescibacteria group bacterium]
MKPLSVAFATYKDLPQLQYGEHYLLESFHRKNIATELVPWDDPTVDWQQYSYVLPLFCWNYHLKYKEFINWLEKIHAQGVRIVNPIETIKWNSQKPYLLDLEQRRVPIIPTTLIRQNSILFLDSLFDELYSKEIIIKPVVGASKYGVRRMRKKYTEQEYESLQKLLNNGDYLVQPYVKEISKGELSFIFFQKSFSHAVHRLYRNVNHFSPDKHFINQAIDVLNAIPHDVLYARLDFVNVKGQLRVMEVELIEPELYMYRSTKGSMGRFVAAFLDFINNL